MKALSARQITLCEESVKPRCRCRCSGALHGVKRTGYVQLALEQRTRPTHQAACSCIEEDCTAPVHIWLMVPEVAS